MQVSASAARCRNVGDLNFQPISCPKSARIANPACGAAQLLSTRAVLRVPNTLRQSLDEGKHEYGCQSASQLAVRWRATNTSGRPRSPELSASQRSERRLQASEKRQPERSLRPRKTKGSVATSLLPLGSLGRGGGIRTRDPLRPMPTDYPAACKFGALTNDRMTGRCDQPSWLSSICEEVTNIFHPADCGSAQGIGRDPSMARSW
jgi:hypothetical protein